MWPKGIIADLALEVACNHLTHFSHTTWNGTTKQFLTHWETSIANCNNLAVTPDQMYANTIFLMMLKLAMCSSSDYKAIKDVDQRKIAIGKPKMIYEQYFHMPKSSAQISASKFTKVSLPNRKQTIRNAKPDTSGAMTVVRS